MSNIKFTNNVLLDQTSVDGSVGIDVSNVLATGSIQSNSYTATEDCWAKIERDNYGFHVQINGVSVFKIGNMSAAFSAPLKKGQTLTKNNDGTYTIYGLKK